MDGYLIFMIIMIVAPVVLLLLAFFLLWLDDKIDPCGDGLLLTAVVTFCLMLLVGGIGIPISASMYHNAKSEYIKHMVNIVSLDRGTGVYGQFTLGSGTVEDKAVYYYYYQVRENTYKLSKLYANECYIVETDEYQPSIYKIKEKGQLDPYYNIYVPFGTIVISYAA